MSGILTAILQSIGIIDWLKQTLHDHTVKQAQEAMDTAKDNAATLQEVEHINAVRAQVQNLTHDELIAQYAKLRASIILGNQATASSNNAG